ncbi:crotonase/enoyl-CoA hydratase family protein [Cupriavidus sp. L7L]|uniref:crotonase/enoyl-CoA hydratase family protein n=1 Tax=Cupriavidus sp. L7L TaxID=2546443 RepID=UPI001056574B|nr:crotonase/enoyl-CoA hydratase family protein [Cupriavidus sp. L7L]TDF64538.1 crotonase/enoyl-CoA hydratase family protein [Cupriavidus sp. L7L]
MSESTRAPEVRMSRDGHIGVITIDNAAKKNALTPEMMQQYSSLLTEFEQDDDLWVLVIDPAGEHTTAGLDMPKFFGPTATAKPIPEGQVDPFGLKRRCTKPVIFVVQGITYTAGIEMMLASDIVIAADTARFGQVEAKRGIAPFGGAHFRYLTRTGWGNAMYHLFLCEEFTAQRALELGFVQEVHPYGKHRERALELAQQICKCAPLGLRATKIASMKFLEAAEKAAIEAIPEIRRTVLGSEDFKEGIKSFMERREAVFEGR